MAVESHHPDYDRMVEQWQLQRDAADGPHAVWGASETYLPKPSGFTAQPDSGVAMYEAYMARARFPDILAPTLRGMVGLIHRTEFDITGLEEGRPLAPMWERATRHGLTLEAFSQQITSELLLMGRYAVLPDLPESGGDVPWLAGYTAETLINWDEENRDLFVLDESRLEREPESFEWTMRRRYRVLRLTEDGRYTQEVHVVDRAGEGRGATETVRRESEPVAPTMRGEKNLDQIPLVVAGPRFLSIPPEVPPLVGVSRAAIAAYQLDADYRHQLFASGQETLVLTGISKENGPAVIGAGVIVYLAEKGTAQYVGPSGVGIEKHKIAIDDAKADAVRAGAKLLDTQDVPDESGKSRKLRYVVETATLTSVAQSSAACLEQALRYAALFVGQDPEEIVVTPNLEFVDAELTPQEAQALVGVWQSGAISYETLYDNLQRGRIASQERTAEEEQELVDQETPDEPLAGAPLPDDGSGSPATDEDVSKLFDSRFVETGEGLEIEA